LGLKEFISYTEDNDLIFEAHGLCHHSFADNTQAYIAVPLAQAQTIVPRCLQECIADISDWCA